MSLCHNIGLKMLLSLQMFVVHFGLPLALSEDRFQPLPAHIARPELELYFRSGGSQ